MGRPEMGGGAPRANRLSGAFEKLHSGRKAGMQLGLFIAKWSKRRGGFGLATWAPLALLVPAASCVPGSFAAAPETALTRAEIQAFTAPSPLAITNNAAPGTSFLVGDQ